MTPDDLDAIRARDAAGQPLREFDSFERAVAALRAFVEETTEDRRALLAEVDRLDREKADAIVAGIQADFIAAERARIEKAVRDLPFVNDPVTEPGAIDRAAVLAIVEGDDHA